MADVPAVGAVKDGGQGVVEGGGLRGVQVPEAEVRRRPGDHPAGAEAQGLVAPHHHLPHLPEGVVLRLVVEFAQQGEEPCLLQGVHRVGTGRPVGADAEVDPPPLVPDGAPLRPQLHVGLGADGDEGILPQQRQVPFLDPKAVGHDAGDGEAPGLGHHLEGGLAVLLPALRHLAPGLRDMEVDAAALLPGRLHQGPQHLRGADVGGVRAKADVHHGVIPVLLHQRLHRPHLRPRIAVKGEHRPGDVGPDAGLLGRPGDLLPLEVVVGKGGDPVVQHLGAAEFGPPVDVLRQDLALVGPYLLVEPVVHVDILGDAPEDVHGGMGVEHRQAGADEQPGAVHHLRPAGLQPRPPGGDDAVPDQQVLPGGDVPLLVDQVAVFQ